MMNVEEIENLIKGQYRKSIWVPFIDSIKSYNLLEEGDKVALCISGGKDSVLLSILFRMLKKISDFPFEYINIVMDPGYSEETISQIKSNLQRLEVDATFFKTNIFNVADKTSSPCYLCARMRRGYLYKEAQERGCNKIALGHHLNDVIETLLLNLFYSSRLLSMPPKLKSKNYEGMELIRPLYRVKEESIKAWCDSSQLKFIECACSVTRKEEGSKRDEIKAFISQMKTNNKNVENSIFNAMHNINISTFPLFEENEE